MEQRPSTPVLAGIVLNGSIGIGSALYLTKLHLDLVYGEGASAICDLSDSLNCSAVRGSLSRNFHLKTFLPYELERRYFLNAHFYYGDKFVI